MKKQNILDLFCDDIISDFYKNQENFQKCINDFDKCINNNIIPFLVNNQEDFGFVFDLNSNNKSIKEKSEYMLKTMTDTFKYTVSLFPDFFLTNKEKLGFDKTCSHILLSIMMGHDTKSFFDL